MVSEERASHPVGTSVRVVDFLKNLPVRRQTALKLPFKTLSNITRTLRAYAIARPAIRFSVKVLKAKNEKSNWTYAPKAGGSVQDAATKVVGKKVIEQCQWKIWNSHERSPQNEVSEALAESDDTFIIEALLANPACGRQHALAAS